MLVSCVRPRSGMASQAAYLCEYSTIHASNCSSDHGMLRFSHCKSCRKSENSLRIFLTPLLEWWFSTTDRYHLLIIFCSPLAKSRFLPENGNWFCCDVWPKLLRRECSWLLSASEFTYCPWTRIRIHKLWTHPSHWLMATSHPWYCRAKMPRPHSNNREPGCRIS